jgi:hypothetical protein
MFEAELGHPTAKAGITVCKRRTTSDMDVALRERFGTDQFSDVTNGKAAA